MYVSKNMPFWRLLVYVWLAVFCSNFYIINTLGNKKGKYQFIQGHDKLWNCNHAPNLQICIKKHALLKMKLLHFALILPHYYFWKRKRFHMPLYSFCCNNCKNVHIFFIKVRNFCGWNLSDHIVYSISTALAGSSLICCLISLSF